MCVWLLCVFSGLSIAHPFEHHKHHHKKHNITDYRFVVSELIAKHILFRLFLHSISQIILNCATPIAVQSPPNSYTSYLHPSICDWLFFMISKHLFASILPVFQFVFSSSGHVVCRLHICNCMRHVSVNLFNYLSILFSFYKSSLCAPMYPPYILFCVVSVSF